MFPRELFTQTDDSSDVEQAVFSDLLANHTVLVVESGRFFKRLVERFFHICSLIKKKRALCKY